jgi:hypothetical protein
VGDTYCTKTGGPTQLQSGTRYTNYVIRTGDYYAEPFMFR